MPGVMNQYIKFENAGDQFVGKCVSGHTRLSKEFDVSPAYFDFSSCTSEEKQVKSKELDSRPKPFDGVRWNPDRDKYNNINIVRE